jgi:16S rRNA (guanine966-N2)-methyltransferase
VRETLFNWLTPTTHGARCLDLFAGSGALGLEALSRGAAFCDFVDTCAATLRQIEEQLQLLQAGSAARCHLATAQTFLERKQRSFDLVFIDPPFGKALVDSACDLLARQQLVAPGGLIYVETAVRDPVPQVPPDWQLHREKTAGEVAYRLYAGSS